MGYKALTIIIYPIIFLILFSSQYRGAVDRNYTGTTAFSLDHIIIYEFHPYSYPSKQNEYICIYNPTDRVISLQGYFITDGEGQIPLMGIIDIGCKYYIAESEENFTKVMGFSPNLIYANFSKKFSLGNLGDNVLLCCGEKIVDAVYYGECEVDNTVWKGDPLPKPSTGLVYRRANIIDTDSAEDWISRKVYIGQSDYKPNIYFEEAEIVMFVLPDADFTLILEELKNAKESIIIQSYRLSSKILIYLLSNLSNRVRVEIFLEGNPLNGFGEVESSLLMFLQKCGCHIRTMYNNYSRKIYDRYRVIESSYIVVDNSTLIILTGHLTDSTIPSLHYQPKRAFGIIVRNTSVAKFIARVFYDDFSPIKEDSVTFSLQNHTINTRLKLEKPKIFLRRSIFSPLKLSGKFKIIPVVSPDFSICVIANMLKNSNYICGEIESIEKDVLTLFPEKIRGKIILANNSENTEILGLLSRRGLATKLFINSAHLLSGLSGTVLINSTSILLGSVKLSRNSLTENREISIIIENETLVKYVEKVLEHDWKSDVTPPIAKIEFNHRDGIYYFYAKCTDESFVYYKWYIDEKLVSVKASFNITLLPGEHKVTLHVEDEYGNYSVVETKIVAIIRVNPRTILLILVLMFYAYYIFNISRKNKR